MLGSSMEKVTDAESRSLCGCSGEHSVLTAEGESTKRPLEKAQPVEHLLRQIEKVVCTQCLKAGFLEQSTGRPCGKRIRICIHRAPPYNSSRNRIPGIVFDNAT
ncbi:MAG: hypothetical protein QOJ51_3849 [Acidobacteriaceae bacterium]|nr:hypothetical protein [Acidobacteriaceae bacterium]